MDASFARYRGYLTLTIVFILVLIGTVYFVQRREPTPLVITTPTPRATPTAAVVLVDVRGAVANPGVYALPEGSRLQDALKSAGNPLINGDTSALNFARKLNDGEQIFVPTFNDATPTLTTFTPAATLRLPSSACLPYKDAPTHVNETTCVRGSVSSTNQSPTVFSIYFDDTTDSFYAVSFGHKWDNLRNKCVEISGKITMYRNRAQIVIDRDEQLSFCR